MLVCLVSSVTLSVLAKTREETRKNLKSEPTLEFNLGRRCSPSSDGVLCAFQVLTCFDS